MAAAFGVGALLVAAVTAPASPSPPVRVVLPECGEVVSLPAFVDALRVELAGGGRACCETGETGSTAGADRPGVDVQLSIASCDQREGRVGVAIRTAEAGRTAGREISLADLPSDARPRALALAVAEMIREAERAEPQPPPPATPEPAPPAAPAARAGGAATGELRLHANPNTALWGARLAAFLTGERWRAGLELAGANGSANSPQGQISLRAITVGASAGSRWRFGAVAIDAGVAAEIGAAFVNGTTNDAGVRAESGSGFVALAGLRVGVEAPASGDVRFRGVVQVGGTLRGLTGDINGVPDIGLAGAFVLVGVGLSL
jgi:hypothetical protein